MLDASMEQSPSPMPMALAQRKCPEGIFLPGNCRQYGAVSAQIFEFLARFSPLIEPLIDEGFLDLTGMEHLLKGNPRAYGQKLKEAIRADTGPIASVGIAPNKFLAKIPPPCSSCSSTALHIEANA